MNTINQVIQNFTDGIKLFFGLIWAWVSGFAEIINQFTGIPIPVIIAIPVIALIGFIAIGKIMHN